MPSFKRRASVLDAERVSEPAPQPGRAEEVDDALALAEEAEAEAAEAEAAAAAARARARAIRLRREAAAAEAAKGNGTPDTPDPDASDAEAADAEAADAEASAADDTGTDTSGVETSAADTVGEPDGDAAVQPEATRTRRRRLPGLSWKRAAVGAAVLVICAALAASGYMVWHHRQATDEQQRAAEYAAAARQSVVSLMSLDFNKAEEDVQRIIDNSTGQFKEEFESQAEAFAQVAQESKVITEVTVNSAAVKEMDEDSALVLVSATSKITNSTGARQDPRSWRLAVDLDRDGDQIKMSKVEFVP
ncbi:hypothetical protein AU195_22690 [Mycobacterium sp. IS-1496]|uniref:hypothetical protein n=1 Tax=Mycobacterium sp. IS-1496 TaxID=1772284 RepID=UPI0007417B1D|nr:hypothetical protein [Mycobacterium sp. IS-1496]KUI38807.1 hypothetical protein AU195_22690 [Mycobacterium sp. IS-1496]